MVLAQLKKFDNGYICINMFPSHIGSRSTDKAVERDDKVQHVSIPHWFSLNSGRSDGEGMEREVSIPHWFSLNEQGSTFNYFLLMCFHPTLVLAQQSQTSTTNLTGMFPSHIGSRSTPSGQVARVGTTQFPSHIGSRSTE